MKRRIEELEIQLSQALAQENMLKSETTMLLKQLQRLTTKVNRAENQSSKEPEDKHQQHLALQLQQIRNCENTIQKYEQLYRKFNSQKVGNNSVIVELTCQTCGKTMKPYKFFSHMREGCGGDCTLTKIR